MELVLEKWSNKVNILTLGNTKTSGETREKTITIGGEETLPFLHQEGKIPYRPVIAMEVQDMIPEDWPLTLEQYFKDVWHNSAYWAQKCVEEYKADLIFLNLISAHPDTQNRNPEEVAQTVKEVSEAVKVPLIIVGCGEKEKDNLILPRCSEAVRGENCLFGIATQENYKVLTAVCLADNHNIIALSPLDINIAKQLNILISDMGMPLERIVIYPTTGALGYGMEYAYSIMERSRLAALGGDKMLAMPIICLIGEEVWRTKEAKALQKEYFEWGDESERGPMWETITAITFLHAGADILVMRHPKAVEKTFQAIDKLMKKGN